MDHRLETVILLVEWSSRECGELKDGWLVWGRGYCTSKRITWMMTMFPLCMCGGGGVGGRGGMVVQLGHNWYWIVLEIGSERSIVQAGFMFPEKWRRVNQGDRSGQDDGRKMNRLSNPMPTVVPRLKKNEILCSALIQGWKRMEFIAQGRSKAKKNRVHYTGLFRGWKRTEFIAQGH